MLSCLSFISHGKRSAASLDRAAAQHELSRAHGQQVGKSFFDKFAPGPSISRYALRSLLKQPPKLLSLGKDSKRHVRLPSIWRHSPAMMSAVLEKQRAPPAPPNGPPWGGGGGGGDGNDGVWSISTISKAEADRTLTDWVARGRVYKMDAQFGNAALAARHAAEIDKSERLLLEETGRETYFALDKGRPTGVPDIDRESRRAVASVLISPGKGLVINDVAVHPLEVNDLTLRAGDHMRHVLETRARFFSGG